MKKTFSILFLILSLASCGKGGGGSNNSSAGDLLNSEIDPDSTTVPNMALTFNTDAKLIGFSRDQETKLEEAMDLIKKVVASEKFKSEVLSKTYNGKKTYVDNGGLSNIKIYQLILEAAEKLGNTSTNNTMNVEIELYTDNSSIALGYTYVNVERIWLNKKYYDDFEPYQVAGNLFHEWLHKLGFKHALKDSASRPHSVPYYIGYLIRDIAKDDSNN